ncbi:MAG: hypothetical protein NZM04_09755 [Methylacidiphilales bacterium]|nr:hypothetical protein [Candidatus Methylacidiphilales bacterium]
MIGAVGMGLALVDYLSVEPLALFVVPSGAVRAVLSSAFVRADHEQGRLVKSSIPSSIVLAWSAAVVALDVALNGFRSGISQYDYIMALTFSMVLGAFVHTQDFQGTMVSRPLTVAEQVLLSLGQAVVVFAVSFAFSPGLGLVVRFLG